ncbi:MAG: hypothetical protein LBV23_11865 [Deltaproteobacteria bacterium]|jgi:tetratricopeptide (TPR) repeat protein|nr:hypothetical protein [Deltaproteobacteria bacterium]
MAVRSGPYDPFGKREASVELSEAEIFSLKALAQLYLRLGASDKAERTLKAIIAIIGPDVECLGQLAALELQGGRPQQSLEWLEELENLKPDQEKVLAAIELIRAKALRSLERLEEAEKARDKYIEIISSVKEER